jgi:hypothetical protein
MSTIGKKAPIVVLCFISVAQLIGISCKKKNESPIFPAKPVKVTPIASSLYKYADFKNNSYWVYRDSTANSVDSFYVVNYVKSGDTLSSSLDSDTIRVTEFIKYTVKSNSSFLYECTVQENNIFIELGSVYKYNTKYTTFCVNWYHPPSIGYKDSISVENKTYKNVYAILTSNYACIPSQPCITFKAEGIFAPDIGLIKITDWLKSKRLLRYKVIQ